MTELTQIQEKLEHFLNEKELHLYELSSRKEDGNTILEISLDEHLDLNQISEISSELSAFMDTLDPIEGAYLLDVTCAGLERAIRNKDEMTRAIGSYIAVSDESGEILGDLLSFDGNVLQLQTKEKNIIKKKEIPYDRVLKARMAVKF